MGLGFEPAFELPEVAGGFVTVLLDEPEFGLPFDVGLVDFGVVEVFGVAFLVWVCELPVGLFDLSSEESLRCASQMIPRIISTISATKTTIRMVQRSQLLP